MTSHLRSPAALMADPEVMSATILTRDSDVAGMLSEWQALFEAVDSAAWSCHPRAFLACRELFRRPGSTPLAVVRDGDGRLRGVMPLMRDRVWRGPKLSPRYDYDPRDLPLVRQRRRRPIPVQQLTALSSLPATLLWVGPLCRPGDRALVCDAIAGAIHGLPGWQIAVFPAHEGEEAAIWQDAFARHDIRSRLEPLGRVVQDLRDVAPFQEVVDRNAGKFRQNVRRARAAAGKAGLQLEVFEGAAAVAARFGTIDALARASWKHAGRADTDVHIAYDGEQRQYFERFLAEEDAGAVPVLGVASDPAGELVVLLMLRHGDRLTALLTFWNGRLPKCSPGLLLFGACIDWANDRGLQHIDFNATAPWIRHLSDSRQRVCHVIACAPRLDARALWTAAGLVQKLR
ncbi:GNAT family N-acetyltransferase [Acidimangrovimonas pyrenivorans]|uniref:GNAT family N-acetyltransferase n=1 Tax=Acidimangrovimonas pyrenivorans TaxID=2030798 RepID=A0ABV7AFY3_9RHOB